MSEALANVERLRRTAERLAQSVDSEFAWLGAGILAGLETAHSGGSIDGALGLRPAAGQTPWWESERRRNRDAILRRIAKRDFPGGSLRGAARLIAQAVDRYAASPGWKRCRGFVDPPAVLDPITQDLFKILKLGLPAGEATVRVALASETPVLFSHEVCEPSRQQTMEPSAACEQPK